MASAYLWAWITVRPYYDPLQPSPGFAALGTFFIGAAVVILIAPVALGVVYWVTARRGGVGCVGCSAMWFAALLGLVVGMAHFNATWDYP